MALLIAELRKYWHETCTYYADSIVGIITTYILFVTFFMGFKGTASLDKSYYIGFLFWYFASNIISEASTSISSEKQSGTLEQLLTKRYNIVPIIITKSAVWLLFAIVKSIFLVLLITITIGVQISFNLLVIPVMLVVIWGLLGLGLFLAGLTIKYTKTASFESIISYVLLFLSGTLIDNTTLPKWLQTISLTMPLTRGIDISRNIIRGAYVPSTEFYLLILTSSMYFIFGLSIFYMIYKHGTRNGISNNY